MLRAIEKKILSYLKSTHRGFYVDIGPAVGDNDKIWTIGINNESLKTPLVMLHGLGAGVALWVLNLDSLSTNRPVYAIDLLGFGRSSRPNFSNDAMICEKQFVKSIEEWRREMSIDKMILLGHSMGGFLAASYSISYPDNVKHLILADPWGFPEKPAETPEKLKSVPLWVKTIAYVVQPLNPLWALRAAGPWGQWVVEKTRPDITRKFSILIDEPDLIPQYIHQCNAQSPSGESAFHSMMESFGWAKNPMIKRIQNLREDVPMTVIYGSRSWIDSSAGDKIKILRPNSIVNMRIINGAGHHVYADKPSVFNQYVLEACGDNDSKLDEEKNLSNISNTSTDSQKNTPEATESDQDNERSITTNREQPVQQPSSN
ncbi:(Lyso)-N-acylphosphatidylethanolamine lipase isoform X2 [Condylostylus longicornis]|nr:(Lyso)-N-acylphosphatidylethanolamine lipase isoform X2 [Condylostylus longicornis]